MTAHTPGPWALQLADECTGRKLDELVQWVVTANDHDLWISTGPTWDSEHSEESLANARLIAAAPELLRAAEQAQLDMAWAESVVPGTNFQASLILLRASIAKAKGEPDGR